MGRLAGRSFDIVTFDCYGTLIDWEGGIAAAFAREAAADGIALDRGAVLAAHAEIEPRVQAEGFRSYAEVLRETAFRAGPRLGWPISRERAAFLAASLGSWPPFPDTNPALERLAAAGYRLGILSNVDDALLAATRRTLVAAFEPIVTAEQVRSYKPAPGHFLEARRWIGGASWLHAAQSWFHDVEPAAALGIPVAWVNRKGERAQGAARPDYEVRDLALLATLLCRSPDGLA